MEDPNPPKLLILPNNASSEARICTLAHPRTSQSTRYFFDPSRGLYEFTRVAAPKAACRSWLIAPRINRQRSESDLTPNAIGGSGSLCKEKQAENGDSKKSRGTSQGTPLSKGYTIKEPEILLATPIDYLYHLLRAISDAMDKNPHSSSLYLPADDFFDLLVERSNNWEHIICHPSTRPAMEARLKTICDTICHGDERMYRLSDEKLNQELIATARRIVAAGLPASLEEKFIRRALETPIMGIKHEDSSPSDPTSQTDTPTSAPGSTPSDSQTSVSTAITTESATSTAPTTTTTTTPSPPEPSSSDTKTLPHLLRLRTTLTYIQTTYIPPSLHPHLFFTPTPTPNPNPPTTPPIDFTPLTTHLTHLATLRAEALASRSLSDFSRNKRTMHEEDDDAAAVRAEKKRKKDEEEKKKKAEPRGLRELRKADTRGMKKMSDFFGGGGRKK